MASGGKPRRHLRKAEALGYRTEETAKHWLVPIPIYSKKLLKRQSNHQDGFVTSAFRDNCQVPWESLAVPPSTMERMQSTPPSVCVEEKMLAKAPKKDSFPARAGHLVSSDAPTNLHGNPLHRRSLSGILARSGTKNSALTRAERKNRQKKVPFKDAVNALHPEDRPGCIQTTLAQYMSEEEQLYPKELELILQTLSLQTEETVMQAAHYLLQRNFFFSLIKVSYTNGSFHRKVLRDLKLFLETSDDSWTGSSLSWIWNPTDRDLFVKQFQNLAIITHYKHVRRQLLCLEHDGEVALARIERKILLKVIDDFLNQLSPENQSRAGRSPEYSTKSQLSTRTFGTQTSSEELANVQVVLNLQCTSEEFVGFRRGSPEQQRRANDPILCTETSQHADFSYEESKESEDAKPRDSEKTTVNSLAIIVAPTHQYNRKETWLTNDQSVYQKDVSCMVQAETCDLHEYTFLERDDSADSTTGMESMELPDSQASAVGDDSSNQKQTPGAIIVYQGANPWNFAAGWQSIEQEMKARKSIADHENAQDTCTQTLTAAPSIIESHESAPAAERYSDKASEMEKTDSLSLHGSTSDAATTDAGPALVEPAAESVNLHLMADASSEIVYARIMECGSVSPSTAPVDALNPAMLVEVDMKVNEHDVSVELNSLEATESLGQLVEETCADSTCEALGQTIPFVCTHEDHGGTKNDAAQPAEVKYYVEMKLLQSETPGYIEVQLQCVQAVEDCGMKQDETGLVEQTYQLKDDIAVEIKPVDTGITLTLIHFALMREELWDAPQISKDMPASTEDHSTTSVSAEVLSGPNDIPTSRPESLILGETCNEVKIPDEHLLRNEDLISDTRKEKSVVPLQEQVVLPVQLKVDETEEVRVVLGMEDRPIGGKALCAVDPLQGSHDLVRVDLVETSPGQIAVLLETSDSPWRENSSACEPVENASRPLKVTLLPVDSSTCLLKIEYHTLKEDSDEQLSTIVDSKGENPAATALVDQPERKLFAIDSEQYKPSCPIDQSIRERADETSAGNLIMGEESESAGFTTGESTESQPLEEDDGDDAQTHFTIKLLACEDGTVSLHINGRRCENHSINTTNAVEQDASQDVDKKETIAVDKSSPVPQEDDNDVLAQPEAAGSGAFPAGKIHKLAEEAAKLEAEIAQETFILNKEKVCLEEHLAQLMAALESHVESQSRASTPEDIQQLQEQQNALIKEIEAEKERLSIVASTLGACFSSPRVEEAIAQYSSPRSSTCATPGIGKIGLRKALSSLGKEALPSILKSEAQSQIHRRNSHTGQYHSAGSVSFSDIPQDLERSAPGKLRQEKTTEKPDKRPRRNSTEHCSSSKTKEGQPSAQEALQAFQEQLAQTKEFAAVLQASDLDPSNQTDNYTGEGDTNESAKKLVVTSANAKKLAALTEQLKQSPEFDEPPTLEEVQKFAEYMGMDANEDKELLYIAEWALTAPLPAGWTVHLDSEGNEFYHHTATKVSQYDHPMDGKYKELYQKLKAEKHACKQEVPLGVQQN